MVKNLVITALASALVVALSFLFYLSRKLSDAPESLPPIPTASEIPPVNEPPPLEPPPRDPLIVGLERIFERAKDDPKFQGAMIGFCLLDAEGELMYGLNETTAQIPASSLKTLTTASALEILGPDFRFQTRLGTSDPANPTQPQADLIIQGGGDPMLSPEDLEKWVQNLVKAGLKTIPGRVIGDGRALGGPLFVDFWDWGDIGNGYGSPVSGLNLAHNRYIAVLSPGEKVGDPAKLLGTFPEVPGVEWWTEVTTSEKDSGDGLSIYGGERASVIHLRGQIPLGGEWEAKGAVPDPERFAAWYLRSELMKAGIEVKGEAVGAGQLYLGNEAVPEITHELLKHQSPPLLDIIKSIHASSDNHETECLFRAIARQTGMSSDESIRSHWKQRGLDLQSLRIVDGSGLARADHIPPLTLAQVQHFAATGPQGIHYVESLLSTDDGRVHFKAGAMSSIRSLTGVVDQKDDKKFFFTLILNHYPDVSAAEELIDSVINAFRNKE